MLIAAAIVVSLAAGFALGIVFHKQFVSEAASIKAHVTAEMFSFEARIKRALDEVKQKV